MAAVTALAAAWTADLHWTRGTLWAAPSGFVGRHAGLAVADGVAGMHDVDVIAVDDVDFRTAHCSSSAWRSGRKSLCFGAPAVAEDNEKGIWAVYLVLAGLPADEWRSRRRLWECFGRH
jgi:hypothetical protein